MPSSPNGSAIATFAECVSPSVMAQLTAADELAFDGRTGEALQVLRAAAAALPAGAAGDDDRIAIGEAACYSCSGGPLLPEAQRFVEHLAAGSHRPLARGALYFHRGRLGLELEDFESLRLAMAEFTRARDPRGRAVTLVTMSWPSKAPFSLGQRRRMASEGLALAMELGDPWVIAYCASKVGTAWTYLGDPAGLEHFALAAEKLIAVADPATAHLALVNYANWGLSAFALGCYQQARQIFADGQLIAVTDVWLNRFGGGVRLVDWRTGSPLQGTPAAHARGGDMDTIVCAALDLERARRIRADLSDVVVTATRSSTQLTWLARAVQARMRIARNEPNPTRDLHDVIELAVQTETRVGWEDALLVLAEHDPSAGAEAFAAVADLWPDLPRATAARLACQGMLAGAAGYGDLQLAAAEFLRLPEPGTAGRILHRAALVAPTRREGNALRLRALELLRQAGDERAAAAIVRDRALHRGRAYTPIPTQFAGTLTGGLTAREREVAQLAARGLTAAEIAESLSLSVWTVRHHIQRAREKLGGIPKRRLGASLAGEGAGQRAAGV